MGYLRFTKDPDDPAKKTKTFTVINLNQDLLGRVFWHSPWRKYVFWVGGFMFDVNCLQEIVDFLRSETDKQRKLGNEQSLCAGR